MPVGKNRRRLGQGQLDGERAALARFACDAHAAAERLGQVLDDRQAQAGAAELARAGFVDAVEALEDATLVFWLDADAGVADGDADDGGGGAQVLGVRCSDAPIGSRCRFQETVTLPPSGVYLIALSMRLSRISRRPSRSARTRQVGWSGAMASAMRFASAAGRWLSMHEARRPPRRPARFRTPADRIRCGPASACP